MWIKDHDDDIWVSTEGDGFQCITDDVPDMLLDDLDRAYGPLSVATWEITTPEELRTSGHPTPDQIATARETA